MSFNKLWADAKKEIFRLELLDTYLVEEEKENFKLFKEGKLIDPLNDHGFLSWLSSIKEKRDAGTKIIDISVITLPVSPYVKFGMQYFLKTTEAGKEDLLIERTKVKKLTEGFEDYWMFDRKNVIIMHYDKEGHFLSQSKAMSGKKNISKYVELEKQLLKIAIPLKEFLKIYKIEF